WHRIDVEENINNISNVSSSGFTIQVVPVVARVNITPFTPNSTTPVAGVWNYTDAEGDAENGSTWTWFVNGSEAWRDAALLGYWRFDSNALDQIGNSNGAEINITNTSGIIRTAFSFNGTNQFVLAGNHTSFNTGFPNITISAWIKTNGTQGNGASPYSSILKKGSSSAIELFVGGSSSQSNKLGLRTPDVAVMSTTFVTDNKWHHVVGTRNTINVSVYVDGILSNTTAASSTPILGNTNLTIGRDSESDANFFNGTIDEVKFFNRSLSATEIANEYQMISYGSTEKDASGTPAPDVPVALWHFDDETASPNLTDFFGDNVGVMYNVSRTQGVFGTRGINLTGVGGSSATGNRVLVNFSQNLNLSTNFTIIVWASHSQTAGTGYVFSKYGGSVVGAEYGLAYSIGSNQILCEIKNLTGVSSTAATSANSDGIFKHLACVYNATGLFMYINGTMLGSGAYIGPVNITQQPLIIGALHPDGSNALNGTIDELELYNRPFTATEINQSYRRSFPLFGLNSSLFSNASNITFQLEPIQSDGTVGTAVNSSVLTVTDSPPGVYPCDIGNENTTCIINSNKALNGTLSILNLTVNATINSNNLSLSINASGIVIIQGVITTGRTPTSISAAHSANLSINASEIRMVGGQLIAVGGGNNANGGTSGNGSIIFLLAGNISIDDASIVNASGPRGASGGSDANGGSGGIIIINASNKVNISGLIFATGEASGTFDPNSCSGRYHGNGGLINITSPNIVINGTISAMPIRLSDSECGSSQLGRIVLNYTNLSIPVYNINPTHRIGPEFSCELSDGTAEVIDKLWCVQNTNVTLTSLIVRNGSFIEGGVNTSFLITGLLNLSDSVWLASNNSMVINASALIMVRNNNFTNVTLLVTNDANLSGSVSGEDITVRAASILSTDTIRISPTNARKRDFRLLLSLIATNNITLQGLLNISGGHIANDQSSTGRSGGTIIMRAATVLLNGTTDFSGGNSDANGQFSGNGGILNISAAWITTLKLINGLGGLAFSSDSSGGKGGTLIINGSFINISGSATVSGGTGLSSTGCGVGQGRAGNGSDVFITGNEIYLNAEINASKGDLGCQSQDAGRIHINGTNIWVRSFVRSQGNATTSIGIINITGLNISIDGGIINGTQALTNAIAKNSTINIEFEQFLNITAANISPRLDLSKSNRFGRITLYGINFTSINFNNESLWNISRNKAFVNSTLFGRLNVSGQVRLDNYTPKLLPVPFVDLEDDGTSVVCDTLTTSNCTSLFINATTALFNVTHFTTYSLEESPSAFPCDIGNENGTCIINSSKFINGSFTFLNLTITSTGSIQTNNLSFYINALGRVRIEGLISTNRSEDSNQNQHGANITINASSIEINGTVFARGSNTLANVGSSGRGGRIEFVASNITIEPSGIVNASGGKGQATGGGEASGGNAGSVIFNASNLINISGMVAVDGGATGTGVPACTRLAGDGGTINISAPTVFIHGNVTALPGLIGCSSGILGTININYTTLTINRPIQPAHQNSPGRNCLVDGLTSATIDHLRCFMNGTRTFTSLVLINGTQLETNDTTFINVTGVLNLSGAVILGMNTSLIINASTLVATGDNNITNTTIFVANDANFSNGGIGVENLRIFSGANILLNAIILNPNKNARVITRPNLDIRAARNVTIQEVINLSGGLIVSSISSSGIGGGNITITGDEVLINNTITAVGGTVNADGGRAGLGGVLNITANRVIILRNVNLQGANSQDEGGGDSGAGHGGLILITANSVNISGEITVNGGPSTSDGGCSNFVQGNSGHSGQMRISGATVYINANLNASRGTSGCSDRSGGSILINGTNIFVRARITSHGNSTNESGIINITAVNISVEGGTLNGSHVGLQTVGLRNSTILLDFQTVLNITGNVTPHADIALTKTTGRIHLFRVNITDVNFNNESLWNISSNKAFVNSSVARNLNTSAIIRIDNFSAFLLPIPFVDIGDSGSFVNCNAATTANCSVILGTATSITFNTTHFTTYQIGESPGVYPCDIGHENITCIINSTKILNGSLNFVNLTLTTSGYINFSNQSLAINASGVVNLQNSSVVGGIADSCTSGTCSTGGNLNITSDTLLITGLIVSRGGNQSANGIIPGNGGVIRLTARLINITTNVTTEPGDACKDTRYRGGSGVIDINSSILFINGTVSVKHNGGTCAVALTGGDIFINATNFTFGGKLNAEGGNANSNTVCDSTPNGVKGNGGVINISVGSNFVISGNLTAAAGQVGACDRAIDGNIFVYAPSISGNFSRPALLHMDNQSCAGLCITGSACLIDNRRCFVNNTANFSSLTLDHFGTISFTGGTFLNVTGLLNLTNGSRILEVNSPSYINISAADAIIETVTLQGTTLRASSINISGSIRTSLTNTFDSDIYTSSIMILGQQILMTGQINLSGNNCRTGGCSPGGNITLSASMLNISGTLVSEGTSDDAGAGNDPANERLSGNIALNGTNVFISGGIVLTPSVPSVINIIGSGGTLSINTTNLSLGGRIDSRGGPTGSSGSGGVVTILSTNFFNFSGGILIGAGTNTGTSAGNITFNTSNLFFNGNITGGGNNTNAAHNPLVAFIGFNITYNGSINMNGTTGQRHGRVLFDYRENLTFLSNYTDPLFPDIAKSNLFGRVELRNVSYSGINLNNDSVLNISNNSVYVNATATPQLNTSATITLLGINLSDPKPLVRFADSGSFVDCPASICQELGFNSVAQIYTFNVTHFTSFSAGDSVIASNVSNSTVNNTVVDTSVIDNSTARDSSINNSFINRSNVINSS
ncbi:MAG: LamG domain-containing protein, partial [Nanoarchaeota archaeon]